MKRRKEHIRVWKSFDFFLLFFLFSCNIIPSCITREFYAWLLQKFVKKRLIYSNEICGYSYKMIIYRIIDIFYSIVFHSNISLKKFHYRLSHSLYSFKYYSIFWPCLIFLQTNINIVNVLYMINVWLNSICK